MEAYKERMVKEYNELKDRTYKLSCMLTRYDAGTLGFEPTCPIHLLREQFRHMDDYLRVLEQRAFYEDIEL